MVDKKMEGDEQQRRARARRARESGGSPSASLVTTGASKQPHRTDPKDPHQERLSATTRGKQQSRGPEPAAPPAPNLSEEWSRPGAARPPTIGPPAKNLALSAEQGEVYQAVADLEANQDPSYLSRIADAVDRPVLETRRILGDLLDANLVQEVQATEKPDFGPQYLLTAKT